LRVAVLEDDRAQAELLLEWLEQEGHQVRHAVLSREFLDLFKSQPFDLLILDWQLPDQSGLEVLKTIRGKLRSDIPVLFATQRDSEDDIVSALRAGADDYLVKPLRHGELVARLQALLRRAGFVANKPVLELDQVVIDTRSESIRVAGEPAKVTHKDYLLAVCLLSNVGKVLSRRYLLNEIWGVGADLNTRTVDVHISRVRRSLKIGPEMGYCIKNIFQHGYRLEKIEP
jgi:DNA-binding response OmpR family regulator